MDRILNGVFASDHSENVKNLLIQQLVTKASNAIPETQCRSIFKISSEWMLKGGTAFNHDMGKLVLISWAKHHKDVFQQFFTMEYLKSVLADPDNILIHVVNYVRASFGLLRDTSHIFSLCTVVRDKACSWVKDNQAIEFNAAIGRLLIDHDHCWPVGDRLLQFSLSLVHSLAKTELPKSSKEELKACIQNAGIIGALLSRMWARDQSLLFPVLNETFTIISALGPHPSVAIASIVQYFPQEVIESATRTVVSRPGVSNQRLELALVRMIKCLSWPGGKAVDQWIIRFVKDLAMVQKHSILVAVTNETVSQVFSRLYFPIVRESAMAVLSHLLLSYQHSPQPFHQIVEHVPELVKTLRREDSVSSQSMLQTLAELLHCLMFQHTGFPELYGPILDVVQDLPRPSDATINKWLAQSGAWSTRTVMSSDCMLSPVAVTPKSETGKAGLVNLGNTCYLNSMLQAIFMLDEFRSLAFLRPTTVATHPLLYHLQEVFAYLFLTQRAAVEPVKFLQVARPPWFSPGTQQDCSEFQKYLLDRIDEEDKIPCSRSEVPQERSPTLLEKTFVGKLLIEHSCRRCSQISCREEAFTDLPLAFPRNTGHVERPLPSQTAGAGKEEPVQKMDTSSSERSLKGGDIAQNSSDITSPTGANEGISNAPACSGASSSGNSLAVPRELAVQSKEPGSSLNCISPSVSLHSLLDYFLQPEVLEGCNQYHCEQCHSLQDAERRVSVSESPQFLVLTLKRFAYNVKTQLRSKILQNVEYPLLLKLKTGSVHQHKDSEREEAKELDSLSSSSSSSSSSPLKRTRQDSGCETQNAMSESKGSHPHDGPSETVYGLCSVIVHSGTSSESGHYYCYARASSSLTSVGNSSDEQCSRVAGATDDFGQGVAPSGDTWYLFNDSRVSFARYNTFADVTKRFPKDTPYILIYKNLSEPRLEFGAGIREDFLDAVQNDNRFYQQAQERERRIRAGKKVWSPPSYREDRDDDSDRGPTGSCGGGPGYSAPFNRFIF